MRFFRKLFCVPCAHHSAELAYIGYELSHTESRMLIVTLAVLGCAVSAELVLHLIHGE